jgi:hypothetical protein
MDLKLLNALFSNIITYNKCVHLKESPRLIHAEYLSTQGADNLWHIEIKPDKDNPKSNIYLLWTKREWMLDEERRQRLRDDSVKYNAVLDERKEIFAQLRRQICHMLELGEDAMYTKEVTKIAERMMKKKSRSASVLFDIDLTEVPELPAPVKILDGGYEV